MSRSFVSVWNEALGSWVAASECATARGKRSRSRVVAAAASIVTVPAGVVDHRRFRRLAPDCRCAGRRLGLRLGLPGDPARARAVARSWLAATPPLMLFSLNNAGADNAGAGFFAATARTTGYTNGTLELLGTQAFRCLAACG
ncbi:ESPR domain-containing protein [Paraburkholderia panacisoli]